MVSESDFRAFILENWQNSSKISDILITKVYIRNTLEFQSHVPSWGPSLYRYLTPKPRTKVLGADRVNSQPCDGVQTQPKGSTN